MSKKIDEKIVEMRFDNRNFETNAKTTLSTLDKLKAKLNLTGASKGLENINTSAKKVNMNGIVSSLDVVHSKFSALEVIGVGALLNIGNAAANAGKRLISSLSGMKAAMDGFDEYSMTMNTVQTLVNSTGKSVKEVEKHLKELDDYADKTVYSTADMFNNIYKFTNAGIDLDTAKTAMIGIANATAYAGQGAQQASIAYYNLAQSMSMGYLTTIDYKSLNLANIATKEFKQRMADAAVASGTLKKVGDDLYSTGKKQYTLQALFTEGLKDQWATTNVMMDVFKQYGSQETEIGKKAWAAAQEVKTFGMMMESLKAQAGTGWKDTWQILFGGLDDAKRVWTGLSNFIGRIIDGTARWRNTILDIAMNNPLKELFDKINNSSALKTFQEISNKVKGTTRSLEEYQNMITKIWRGDYKNQPYRKALVEAEGYNFEVTQSLVNLTDEMAGYGKGWQVISKITQEDVIAAEKKYGLYVEQVTDDIKKEEKVIEELTDERLKAIGLSDDEIYMYRQLEKGAKKYGLTIEELAKKMDSASGRDLLYGSADGEVVGVFQNIGRAITNVFSAIKKGWTDVFEGFTGVDLYMIIEKINKFTEAIRKSTENQDKMRKLSETFRGLFSAIHIVVSIIGSGLKIAFQVLKGVLSAFNIDILDFTSFIGNAIYALDRWLTENNIIVESVKAVTKWIINAVIAVKDWIVNNEKIMNVINRIKEAFSGAGDSIKSWFKGLKETDNIPKYIFSGLINGIKENGPKVLEGIKNLGLGLIEVFKNILGIHSPSKVMFAIGGFIIAGLAAGMLSGSTNVMDIIKGIGEKIAGFFKKIDLGNIIAIGLSAGIIITAKKMMDLVGKLLGPLEGLTNLMNGLGSALSGLGEGAKNVGKAIKLHAISALIKSVAISIGILVASIWILAKLPAEQLKQGAIALTVVTVVVAAFVGLLALLSKRLKDVHLPDMGKMIGVIIGISAGMWLMAKALKTVSKIEPDRMVSSIAGLAACALSLTVLLLAMAVVAKAVNGSDQKAIKQLGKIFTKIGLSMLMVALALKMMNKVEDSSVNKIIGIIASITLLLVSLAVINRFTGSGIKKASESIRNVGLTLLLLVVAMKLAGKLNSGDFKKGIKVIGVFLGLLTAMMVISKVFKETEMIKVTGSILMVTVAIGLLAVIMKLMSNMEPSAIKKGITCVGLLGVLILALIGVSKNSSSFHGTTLIGVAAAIAAMGVMVFLLGQLDPAKAKNGLVAVGFITIFVSILLKAAKNFDPGANAVKTLITLTVMLSLLAVALVGLSFIDMSKLLTSASSLGAVMMALAFVIKQVGKMKIEKGIISTLITITLVIAAMAGILVLLSNFTNPEKAIASALSLSVIMIALSIVIKQIGKTKIDKGAMSNIGSIILITAAMSLILIALSHLANPDNAIKNILALSILMGMCAVLLIALNKMPVKGKAISGVLILTAMALPLLAFVGLLLLMKDVSNAIENAIALSLLATVLTALLIPLMAIGTIMMSGVGAGAVILGILALTAMALPLLAFIGVLKGMNDIDDASTNIKAITDLMMVLSTMLTKLALIGPLLLVADIALLGLIAIIGVFGVLATAIGALTKKFPALEDFLNKGIQLLILIAEGLGTAIGKFVGALAESIMSVLPKIGEDLSGFMNNAQDFINGSRLIDDSVKNGIITLVQCILLLTASNILNSIGKFLSGGKSFAELGTELSNFVVNGEAFFNNMPNVDPKSVAGVKTIAEALNILTKSSLVNRLSNFLRAPWDKSNTLTEFTKNFEQIGIDINSFVKNIDTLNDGHIKSIECASSALKAMASVAEAVGKVKTGDINTEDISSFTSKFGGVAKNLRTFIDEIKIFGDEEVTVAQKASEAISNIADASSGIVEKVEIYHDHMGKIGNLISNGEWKTTDEWTKTSTIPFEKFINDIGNLGKNLRTMIDNLGYISTDDQRSLDSISKVMEIITKLSAEVKDKTSFGLKLESYSDNLKELSLAVKEFIDNEALNDPDKLEKQLQCLIIIDKALATITDENITKLDKFGTFFGNDAFKSFVETFTKGDLKFDEASENAETISIAMTKITNALKSYDSNQVTSITSAVEAIKSITELAKGSKEDTNNMMLGFNSNEEHFLVKYANALGKIPEALSAFVTKMMDVDQDKLQSSLTKFALLKDAMYNLDDEHIDRMTNFSEALRTLAQVGAKDFIDSFNSDETYSNSNTAIDRFVEHFINYLNDKGTSDITGSLKNIIKKSLENLQDSYEFKCAESIGALFIDGFIRGMDSKKQPVIDKAIELGKAADTGLKAGTDEHSPSKLAEKSGRYFGEGFIIGISSFEDKVYNETYNIGDTAKLGLSRAIKGVSNLISEGIDDEITIRPVLDLSNVRSGAAVINGMFDTPSVGLNANLNAISSGMSMMNNQATGNDLLSAIDKLSKNLGNTARNTYNINGITYDDGSEISNAVETLVRAARIERRT